MVIKEFMQNVINFFNDNYLVVLFSATVLSTFAFASTLFKASKFPIVQLLLLIGTYVVTLLKPVSVFFFNVEPIIADLKMGYDALTCIIVLAFLLIIHIIFVVRMKSFSRGTKLYQVVPSNIESSIYAYYDPKSKLLMYTSHFYNKVKIPAENKKPWYKQAAKIVCDLKAMTYHELNQYLRGFEDKKFDLTIEFDDYRVVDLKLQKVKIMENDKLRGYILVDQKMSASQLYREGTKKEFKLQLHMFFDSLNEAVAYYDNDLDKYRLTEPMTVKLDTTEQMLGIEELKNYIDEQDIPEFEKMLKQSEGSNTYRYRLKTVAGLEWQEAVKTIEEGVVYSVFRKAEFKYDKVEFGQKKGLLEAIKNANSEFGLVFMNLKRVSNIIGKKGEEFAEMMIEKYFASLEEFTLKGCAQVFRLSTVEFVLFVKDMEQYDVLVRNISNDVSDLISFDLYSGGNKFRMSNALGLVSTNELVEKEANKYIVAGYEALALASDPNYEKDYSIYFAKKDGNADYKFEDYKVDIDNKFLDEIW